MSENPDAEVELLRAEVETLTAEVAFLRSQQAVHVCPSWPQPAVGGGLWVGDLPPFRTTNVGAAGVAETQIMDMTCAPGVTTVTPVLNAAGGCAPPAQTFMVNAGL